MPEYAPTWQEILLQLTREISQDLTERHAISELTNITERFQSQNMPAGTIMKTISVNQKLKISTVMETVHHRTAKAKTVCHAGILTVTELVMSLQKILTVTVHARSLTAAEHRGPTDMPAGILLPTTLAMQELKTRTVTDSAIFKTVRELQEATELTDTTAGTLIQTTYATLLKIKMLTETVQWQTVREFRERQAPQASAAGI